ncbi:MAG: SiaB family protein kinase [Flavobacteriales bacterium]
MSNENSINQFFDIDQMMSDNELVLAYRDEIEEQTVQQLLSMTELKLVQSGEGKKLRKRVFNILVECLQNIVNHSDTTADKSSVASLLLIGRHEGDFFIITGNRILNDKIDALEAKIAEINSWDHANMRDIYSTKLGKSEYSSKGGAGLGLMDIYKRSGRKLKYNIEPIDDEVSFLSFHITVGTDS